MASALAEAADELFSIRGRDPALGKHGDLVLVQARLIEDAGIGDQKVRLEFVAPFRREELWVDARNILMVVEGR